MKQNFIDINDEIKNRDKQNKINIDAKKLSEQKEKSEFNYDDNSFENMESKSNISRENIIIEDSYSTIKQSHQDIRPNKEIINSNNEIINNFDKNSNKILSFKEKQNLVIISTQKTLKNKLNDYEEN